MEICIKRLRGCLRPALLLVERCAMRRRHVTPTVKWRVPSWKLDVGWAEMIREGNGHGIFPSTTSVRGPVVMRHWNTLGVPIGEAGHLDGM